VDGTETCAETAIANDLLGSPAPIFADFWNVTSELPCIQEYGSDE